ncbi:MAG: TIGR01777 family oxidoreductase, partial [Planctomycetota bacterium]
RLDLAAHARFADDSPRRVLVSGATGLVGSSLVPFLTTGGHEIVRLSGSGQGGGLFAGGVRQDRKTYEVDRDALAANGPYDAVVHLAGESIMGRWTESKKRAIRDSRVEGTRKLCEALADLDELPEVLVSTSAIGIYGDRGNEVLTEESATGPEDDFLADVARDWETAVRPAREAGVRVAHPRIGIVLDPRGGALQKMLPLFKLAAGGRLGAGDQWWSWVAVDDVAGAIHHAILDRGVHGPFNVTAPQPVTNAEFTRVLADVVNRPAFVPVPSFGPKVLLGSELAEALLFASCRVTPQALQTSGYPFRFPDLKSCLTHYLGKTRGVA